MFHVSGSNYAPVGERQPGAFSRQLRDLKYLGIVGISVVWKTPT